MLAHKLIAFKKLDAAQHQFCKVHKPFALTACFIGLIERHARLVFLSGRHGSGTQPLFLVAVDRPLHCLGIAQFGINARLLHDAADERELIGRIDDLERGRQIGFLSVRAKDAMSRTVEGSHPQMTQVAGDHGRQPVAHFARGLVREGHGKNLRGARHCTRQQQGDARREHLGLAGTCAGKHQRVFTAEFGSLALHGIERIQKVIKHRYGLVANLKIAIRRA